MTQTADEVEKVDGNTPGKKCVWSAIKRVKEIKKGDLLPLTKYRNCGRHRKLTEAQEKQVVKFVRGARGFARALI